MTDTATSKSNKNDTLRWVLIIGLVVVAFFGAYRFASARTGQPAGGAASQAGAAGTGASGASAGGSACACCSGGGAPTANGITGPPLEGAAVVAGGVQKIAVDVTTVYNPNVVRLKAGVPAEIAFSQAQGCTQVVQSADLGFSEDLGSGPRTVTIKDPKPGTYAFSCGMQMVYGQIVVE